MHKARQPSASQSAGRAVAAQHRDLISLCSGKYAGKATWGFGPQCLSEAR